MDLMVLSNKTSTVAPLSWLIVTDGGYGPLTFTVYKRTREVEFELVNDKTQNYVSDGETINFDVVGLLPETWYDFKVMAQNGRTKNAFSGNISNSGDTVGAMTALLMFCQMF